MDTDAAPFNHHSWFLHSTMVDNNTPTSATTNTPPQHHDLEMIDHSPNATPVANYAEMNHSPQLNLRTSLVLSGSHRHLPTLPSALVVAPRTVWHTLLHTLL